MGAPAAHRAWIGWVRDVFKVSARRACHATGVWRSVVCYKSRRPVQEPLRRRPRERALVRVSYGHKRLHVLLRREWWTINHKRTRRLYREEGLQLGRYRGPKRRKRVGVRRGLSVRVPAEQPNLR
jgi:putative transposase